MTEMKTCPKCDTRLPIVEFGRNRRTPDGLQAWCKPCTNYASYLTALRNKRRDVIIVPLTKRCPRCERTLAAADFNRAAHKSSGLGTYCRQCNTAYQRRYRAGQAQ